MTYTPYHSDWKDYPDVTTPITAAALEYIETGITAASPSDVFDIVKDYSAVGDGTTDDTTALTSAIAAAHAANGGVVYMPVGAYKFTSTLTVPQDVTLRGGGPLGATQGTELVWAGTDDATTYAIKTANTTSGADFSWGRLENFRLKCKAGYTSTPAGIHWRNAQNGSCLSDLYITGFPNAGVYADHSNPDGNYTFPGYVMCQRVWVSGGVTPWHIRAGFSPLLFVLCGADADATTTDAWVIDPPLITPFRGKSAVFTWIGCKSENNGETTADFNGYTFNTDVAGTLIGCSKTMSAPSANPLVNYTVAPTSANDPAGSIPIEIINCLTSNASTLVSAPLATPPVSIAVSSATGGETWRGSWSGSRVAPGAWTGTHPAIEGTTVSLTSPSATSSPLSASPYWAQTANLIDCYTYVVSDTFDRADSASTLGTSSGGVAWDSPGRGTWGISSNGAYLTGTPDDAAVSIETGHADGTLECDITLSSTANRAFPGLTFRWSAFDTALWLKLKLQTQELIFKKVNGGVETTLSAPGITLVAGDTYSIKVVLNGASIMIFVNDTRYVNYTLSGGDLATYLTPTKVGLRQNQSGGAAPADDGGSRYNNFGFLARTTYVDPTGKLVAPTIAPVTVPNVTGSRGSNAALASLLTSLATIGLITDGSS